MERPVRQKRMATLQSRVLLICPCARLRMQQRPLERLSRQWRPLSLLQGSVCFGSPHQNSGLFEC